MFQLMFSHFRGQCNGQSLYLLDLVFLCILGIFLYMSQVARRLQRSVS